MPSLPEHIVAEIKDVARPLRSIVQNFNNRVVVQ
jgi:hypothetical protein